MTNKALPTFSVVVPAYNRPDGLTKCLDALTSLSYPKERYEIIIIDDGSPTPLKPVVDSFKNSENIKFFHQGNSGPATARNHGASKAEGQFLAFTDDDCAPAADWLQVLARQFAAAPNHMIGGQAINTVKGNLYATASQQLISYLYSYYEENPQRDRFFTSNNLALSSDLFKTIGGFDTSFPLPAAEDRELCSRWRYYGYKMRYVPEAVVYHSHTMSFKRFVHQHFNYGRGAYSYHQIRAQREQSLIKPEPFTFYGNLLLYPMSKSLSLSSLMVSSLLFLSQVANVAGFFYEKSRQKQGNDLKVENYHSPLSNLVDPQKE